MTEKVTNNYKVLVLFTDPGRSAARHRNGNRRQLEETEDPSRNKTGGGLCPSPVRLSKKSIDFSDSLPNVSIFGPRSGPKICRCAAQTPANAGFLQTFDSIRRGSRPLVLPLQKRTSFLQTEDFRQAAGRTFVRPGFSHHSFFSAPPSQRYFTTSQPRPSTMKQKTYTALISAEPMPGEG